MILKDNILVTELKGELNWFHQFSENLKLTTFSNKTNELKYCGFGRYICQNLLGEIDMYENFIDSKPKNTIRVQKNLDFTKIPLEEYNAITKLYKMKDWKNLALLHNKYNISGFTICCDLDYISRVFKVFNETILQ